MENPDLLDAARVGFAGLSVSPTVQTHALEALETWLTQVHFGSYRSQLVAMIEQGFWTTLVDSFYRTLPFGTGGRRGTVGVGPNRFNPWTLGTSVEGHARWLRATRGGGPLSVVIGYDVRVFHDMGRQLVSDVPAPIRGMSSRNFAEIAAEVYAAAEIAVHLPPEGTYMSTPELSHAVRALGAAGGLVISASHNPPDDNGSKFYHANGGQMVPPYDEQLGQIIADVHAIDRLPLDRARATGLVREVGTRIRDEYLQINLSCGRQPAARSAHVVFTPLHGTGRATVAHVLDAAGFRVDLEPTQSDYDGAFTNVPFHAPNPERPGTLAAAKITADKLGADLVMACDPDADRLGVSVRHPRQAPGVVDGWRDLNGNELAALVCHQALKHHPRDRPVVFKTEVTSSLVERIANAAGARIVGDLLVGFKYIGEALYALENQGKYRSFDAELDDFAVGVEESHGVLLTHAVRDKDASGGAIVLAELASKEAEQGRTLVDTLVDIWSTCGYVHNQLVSVVMRGASGKLAIDSIMDSMRQAPPAQMGGMVVTGFWDRSDPEGFLGPVRSKTDAASRNVLVWHLGERGRILLRPSGTEPKCKVYVELAGSPSADLASEIPAIAAQCQSLADAFVLDMLARVDRSLPRWALRMDDLVSVDERQCFVENMPTLLDRLSGDDGAVRQWVEESIGWDNRGLYAAAVRAYIETHRPPQGEALLSLFSD